MFNRIVLLYSVAAVVLFVFAAGLMYQYQYQRTIREETDANLKTTHVLSLYLNRQYEYMQNLLRQVYSDGTVSDDMIYFLNHDYEDYLGYRLNVFADSQGSRSRTFDLAVKNYMEQDASVRSVSVYSYARGFSMYVGRSSRRIDFESGSDLPWREWAANGRSGFWSVPPGGGIPEGEVPGNGGVQGGTIGGERESGERSGEEKAAESRGAADGRAGSGNTKSGEKDAASEGDPAVGGVNAGPPPGIPLDGTGLEEGLPAGEAFPPAAAEPAGTAETDGAEADNAKGSGTAPDKPESGRYRYARELQDPWTLRRIGMMVVEFDSVRLEALLQSQAPAAGGQVLVLAADGTVLYDSEALYTGEVYPYRPDESDGASGTEADLPGGAFRTNELSVAGSGLSVLGVVSGASVDRSMAGLTGALILGTLLFAGASLGLAAGIIRSHSKKVQRIIRSMGRIGAGDLSTRIEMPGEDELQQIAQRINAMCERLETYIDKVYTSEIRQKNAELALLQSQINPHFLYNTLESIRMKAYSMGAQDVGKMIYSLSVMFRSLVKKSTIVTVREEIEICSMYLDLFRIRYEGQLQIGISVAEKAADCRMVKLLVQPVVENYILHGFRPLDEDNRIEVRAESAAGRLTIAVEDNGTGIAPERLAEIRLMLEGGAPVPDKEHRSIGLINVHERIRMNYGEDYGVSVESKEGTGTTVRMVLPAEG
ncbi:sensor histidine kinase [Saccharibacillus deserti]|uniref:sensor histidine kinase n=1 Tax=Saccharibacillus deserti TaxID=1634444 RepID=UPI001FEC8D7C|nr:sensor histidine kinase [Saccharibacillus deserti]